MDRTVVSKLVCKVSFRHTIFASRSGRSAGADRDKIKALMEAKCRITTREITEILNLLNCTRLDKILIHYRELNFCFGKRKNGISFRIIRYLKVRRNI